MTCSRKAYAVVYDGLVLILWNGLFRLWLFFLFVSSANCVRKLLKKLFNMLSGLCGNLHVCKAELFKLRLGDWCNVFLRFAFQVRLISWIKKSLPITMIRASYPRTYLTLSIHFPRLLKELASFDKRAKYLSNRRLWWQRCNPWCRKEWGNGIFTDLQCPRVAFWVFYYRHWWF